MRPIWLLVLFAGMAAAGYRVALPGYHFQFPRDHFSHPDFKTEWWYYTGNVRAADGHRFGFEMVFFRQGQRRGPSDNASAWRIDDLYLAHLALTDIDGHRFQFQRRLNRAGPGIAGVSENPGRIWNGNWEVKWETGSGVQTLAAVGDGIRLHLRLTPRKPVVIHGENGVSQTAGEAGRAAYYTSFPLLEARGTVNEAEVSGTAWMDHEWFTDLLDPAQRGWDWFSVQLQNGTELMLFRIRRSDGTIDPHSSGTFDDGSGRARAIGQSEFRLEPLEYWKSPKSGVRYPVKWRIEIPALHVSLECAAAIPDQELVAEGGTVPTYWEGAVLYTGSATGVGYLEMTGYAEAVKM